jgi:hypothetical protein
MVLSLKSFPPVVQQKGINLYTSTTYARRCIGPASLSGLIHEGSKKWGRHRLGLAGWEILWCSAAGRRAKGLSKPLARVPSLREAMRDKKLALPVRPDKLACKR